MAGTTNSEEGSSCVSAEDSKTYAAKEMAQTGEFFCSEFSRRFVSAALFYSNRFDCTARHMWTHELGKGLVYPLLRVAGLCQHLAKTTAKMQSGGLTM